MVLTGVKGIIITLNKVSTNLFSGIVPNIFCNFWKLFIEASFFLLALKDGKNGHTLINDRAMKRNGFDTGLT